MAKKSTAKKPTAASLTKKIKEAATAKNPPSKPLLRADEFSLVFTADEMLSIINILSFSKDIFDQMAQSLNKEGDPKAGEVFSARAVVSQIIYGKFRDAAEIGEPTSREVH